MYQSDSQDTYDKLEATGPGEVPVNTGKTIWNQSQIINQLDSGANWSGNTISYSFPTNASWFPYSEKNGFSQFNAKQKAAANEAIELWDDLIAPSFVQTSGSSGDIKFSNTTTNVGYAHAYFPGGWDGAGSIWLNGNSGSLQDPDIGEWGFMTILHELGHALGLNHAGDYNGGNPTYRNNASHAQDSLMYTIMSYFDEENTGADWRFSDGQYAVAQTPMVHDILAIQSAYGADMSTRSGNTVYGFNSNTGSDVFDFSNNDHPVLTIWDAGGRDVLNLSGFSDDAIVNLAPGSYSDAAGAVNNLAIAFGTWIENVIGGTGNDVMTGNKLGNVLLGKVGADTLEGGNGNDKLRGGQGNDIIFGDHGRDRLYGGSQNDTIDGGGGNDKLYGNEGADTLRGGANNDTLKGGASIDMFVFNMASWGKDTIIDFADGEELMDMRGSGVRKADLNITNSGADAIVDFGGPHTITLLREAGNIDASDFIF